MEKRPSAEQMKSIWSFRLINLLYGFGMATISFIVMFLESTGLTPSQVGVVLAINSALGAIAPPLWALIADKIRSRYRVFLLSATLAAIVMGLIPLSANFRIFGIVLTAVLIPAGNFFRFPGFSMLDTMAMEACNRVGGGVEFSSIRVWRSIGYFILSTTYTPLVDAFGPGLVFYGFAFFIGLVLLMRNKLKQFQLEDSQERESIPLKDLHVSRLVKNYYLIVFVTINLLMMAPLSCNQYILYLVQEVGGNDAMVGLINAARTMANVLMLFAAPFIKRKISMPSMMILAAILYLAQNLLFQVCGSTFEIMLIIALGGGAMGLNLATGVNYVSLMAPKGLEATAISLYAIGGTAMGIVTNAIGGGIVENFGARAIYMFSFYLICAWLVLFLLHFFVGRIILKKEPPIPLFKRPSRI